MSNVFDFLKLTSGHDPHFYYTWNNQSDYNCGQKAYAWLKKAEIPVVKYTFAV